MSDKLISVPVFVQDSGETIILKLSPQDAARATTGKKIDERFKMKLDNSAF